MPDEFALGPGIKAAMEAAADTPASNEWYPIPGLALAAGTDALYVYTPKGGTNRLAFD